MTRGRIAAAIVGAVALLVGAGVIGYRVFVPQESLTSPTQPYPDVVMITDERPFSELRAAPLVVESRLRVYAEKRRVWADAPVGGRYESTPYWSYRRWPAEVVGVVSVSTAEGPLVITQWSDGQLVALNARLGEVAWRAEEAATGRHYEGRRTGASVVYEPRSLLTVRSGDQTVLVVTSVGQVTALAAESGASLWQREVSDECEPHAWTGRGLVVVPACAGPEHTVLAASDGADKATWTAATAPARPADVAPEPELCRLGRSECRLVTAGGNSWLLAASGRLSAVPPIEAGAVIAGDRVIRQTAKGVAARRLSDGAPLWTYEGTGRLIAADTVGVYLLTEDHTVLGLSPVTGRLSVLGCVAARPNEDWRIGHIHTTDTSYLALERITDQPATADDKLYYYGPRPVALVELYPPNKLPVWPGKFAACGHPE